MTALFPANPRRFFEAGALVALACIAFASVYIRLGFLAHSHAGELATLLDRCYRVSLGQVIYRDFYCFTGPVTYFTHGLLYRIFGAQWIVSRYYLALQEAVTVALTFVLLRRFLALSIMASAAAAVATLLWSPWIIGLPAYDVEAGFYTLAAVAALFWLWERPGRWQAGLLGGACALAFLSKQDRGAVAMLLGLAGLLAVAARPCSRRSLIGLLAAYVVGAALPIALLMFYLGIHHSMGSAWYWLVLRSLDHAHNRNYSLMTDFGHKVYLTVFGGRSQVGKLLLGVYAAATVMPWLGRRMDSRPGNRWLRDTMIGLLMLGGAYVGFLSHEGSQFELHQTCLGCAFGLIGSAWHRAQLRRRMAPVLAGALLAGAALLTLRSFHYWVPDVRREGQRGFASLESTAYGDFKISAAQAHVLNTVIRFIRARVKPGEGVFFLPPDFYIDFYFGLGLKPEQPLTASWEWRDDDAPAVLAALDSGRIHWVFLFGDKPEPTVLLDQINRQFIKVARLDEGVIVLHRKTPRASVAY